MIGSMEVKKMSFLKECWPGPVLSAARRHAESGQALAEFALILPMFLLILLGTVDLGQLGYMVIEMAGSARAAAEYGSQSAVTAADAAGMLQAAQQDAPELSNLTVTSSTITCACWTAPGTSVSCATATTTCTGNILLSLKVFTQAQYTPIFKWNSYVGTQTLKADATMPVGQ
jgi:Flp pilus assembly protein TadG